MRKGRRCLLFTSVLLCTCFLSFLSRAAFASEVCEAGNDYYRLFIETDPGSGRFGTFSVGTGPAHEEPENNILHGAFFPPASPRTTYLTVRSWTNETDYVTREGMPESEFTVVDLSDYGKVEEKPPNGFKVTWVLPGRDQTKDQLTIVQELFAEGGNTSLSRVRVTTRVTNHGPDSVALGIRYEWDVMVDANDDSVFRTRAPDGPWQDTFEVFPDPSFKAFEITNQIPPGNLFSIFGTVAGKFGLTPPPTTPDELYYCAWTDAYNHAWNFNVEGGQEDSSVVYFFGSTKAKAMVVEPEEEVSVTAYLATVLFPPLPEKVPALETSGVFALAALLGLLILLRRRV